MTSLFKRFAIVSTLALLGLGPLVLFAGSANASGHTPYQTTRKNAGTPNSTIVKKNSSGVVISYGDSAKRSSCRTARRATARRPTAYRRTA